MGYDDAGIILSLIHVTLALAFYYLIFGMMIGTKAIEIVENIDISSALAFKFAEYLTLWFLIGHGFGYVAMFVFPAILITTFTDIFSILVKLEIVEISRDEEQ